MGSLGTIGKYELLKRLAVGGMAEVFLARQTGPHGFEKMVVIKKILPHLAAQETFVRMFLDEARIAARFNHPNIAQIYELGEDGRTLFIAMEYIHGKDLKSIIRRCAQIKQKLPVEHVVRIASQILDGLHYAHSRTDPDGTPAGIVHRDVTPHNIMASFEGGVKLVDFGIAKARSQLSTTLPGQLKGKFAYMSPEQCISADVDRRSDIFSVGVILFELLTGKRLFKRQLDVETVRAITDGEIEPPSKFADDIDEELEAIVLKALERPREKRYQTAQEMQLALDDYLAHKRLTSSSVHLSRFMSNLFEGELAIIKKALDEANADNLEGAVLSRQEDASLDQFLAMFFDDSSSDVKSDRDQSSIPDWPDWSYTGEEKKESTQPIPSKRFRVEAVDTVEIKPGDRGGSKVEKPKKKTETMWKLEESLSKEYPGDAKREQKPTRKVDFSLQPDGEIKKRPSQKIRSGRTAKPIEKAPPPKPPPGLEVNYKSSPVQMLTRKGIGGRTGQTAGTKEKLQAGKFVNESVEKKYHPTTGETARENSNLEPGGAVSVPAAGHSAGIDSNQHVQSGNHLLQHEVGLTSSVMELEERHGQKWLFFGVLALIFGGIVVFIFSVSGKNATGIKPVYGYVKISSAPPGADIFLDDVRLPSRTPTQLDKITPNQDHKIKVTLPGYPTWEKTFKISDTSKPLIFKAILSEAEAEKARMAGAPIFWGISSNKKGTLIVDSKPRGAEIFLDGVLTGKKTPRTFKNIAADRDHVVLLQLADKALAFSRVHVEEGSQSKIELKLDGIPEAASGGRLKVRIDSQPRGAKVIVNGFPLTKTTPVSVKMLAGGPSRVELVLEGFKHWSRKIRPVPGVDITIKANLEKKR
ncbi:MAG: protein kinase [Deltaproteobacteria bacterium]|nr:protein kinase [Deltaproteobacteria bacterium]